MTESQVGLKVIVCLTCGTCSRLAVATEVGVAAAKLAIGAMPAHRNHYLSTIDLDDESLKTEIKKSPDEFMIFSHTLHTHKNRRRA